MGVPPELGRGAIEAFVVVARACDETVAAPKPATARVRTNVRMIVLFIIDLLGNYRFGTSRMVAGWSQLSLP